MQTIYYDEVRNIPISHKLTNWMNSLFRIRFYLPKQKYVFQAIYISQTANSNGRLCPDFTKMWYTD